MTACRRPPPTTSASWRRTPAGRPGPDSTFATTAAGAPSATAEPATLPDQRPPAWPGRRPSAATTYRFEWGLDDLRQPAPRAGAHLEVRSGDQPVSLALGGLRPNDTTSASWPRTSRVRPPARTGPSDRALPVVGPGHGRHDRRSDARRHGEPGQRVDGLVRRVGHHPPTAASRPPRRTPWPLASTIGPVSVVLTDLAADTTYRYRLVAVNAAGVVEGRRTFRTRRRARRRARAPPGAARDAVMTPRRPSPRRPPRGQAGQDGRRDPVSGTVLRSPAAPATALRPPASRWAPSSTPRRQAR